MLVLAMDTATACTSAALAGPADLLVSAEHVDGRRHAETIGPLIRSVLLGIDMSEIDVIAVGVGPGPFTGLRVGIATALMMGQALGIPVVGACSLDVIGHQCAREADAPVAVVTRARRAEVNWATYDEHGQRTAGPLVLRDEDVPDGWRYVGDAAPFVTDPTYPRGEDLAALVIARLDAGEPLPSAIGPGTLPVDDALPFDDALPVDDATGTGASTAAVLSERLLRGQVLLPPLPVYLRRPDAVVPPGLARPGGGAE